MEDPAVAVHEERVVNILDWQIIDELVVWIDGDVQIT